MKSQTKEFPTLAVASVLSGRLLTDPRTKDEGNGIGQLYELLGWMTGEGPFTHQLPRFGEECKPYLAEQFPGLQMVMANIVKLCDQGRAHEAQRELEWLYGKSLKVAKLPEGVHEVKGVFQDLQDLQQEAPRNKEQQEAPEGADPGGR